MTDAPPDVSAADEPVGPGVAVGVGAGRGPCVVGPHEVATASESTTNVIRPYSQIFKRFLLVI